MNELVAVLPGSNIQSYITSVSKIPHLTQDEELQLSINYYENMDLKSAQKLVMSHLFYVVKIANGLLGYGIRQEDLIQEGNIGLMKAVKNFNPYKGVRFASYAMVQIKSQMYQFILDNWKIVRIATTKAQKKLFFNLKKYLQNNQKTLSCDSIQTISTDLNVKCDDVIEMQKRLTSIDTFYDTTEPTYDDHDEKMLILESVNLIDDESDLNEQLKHSMMQLDKREKDIISQRWLTDKKVPMRTLAKRYNISIERVRQIEKSAMEKMKIEMLNR